MFRQMPTLKNGKLRLTWIPAIVGAANLAEKRLAISARLGLK
jgi:hypothetical protein